MRALQLTRARALSLAAALALLGAAALLSPPVLLAALGIASSHQTSQLLQGSALFRLGLAALALGVIVMAWAPIWKRIPGPESAGTAPSRWEWLALGAILVAATALRLHGLDGGLWLDEILTSAQFAHAPLGEIITTYDSENQHVLYSVLTAPAVQLFGDSPWALRLPAAILGVASVWALYLLGREVAGPREAIFSAALLAFSYVHIWFSQNARGYSGLLFLSLLSSWFLLRALRPGHAANWVGYAVAAALGIYIHATMIFVVLGQGLIYLATAASRRLDWRGWLAGCLGFGLLGLLTFEEYALMLPQVAGGLGREPSLVEEWKSPLWTLLEIARGMQLSFAGTAAALAAAAVFGAGAASYLRTRPVVLALLVIPAGLGAAVTIGLGHHLWPRFFFFAMGFGVLVVMRGAVVVGAGLARLAERFSAAPRWLPAACCAGLVAVSLLSIPRAYGPKQDYLGAAAFVEANRQAGDAVVMAGLAVFPYKNYYGKDWATVETRADLDAARARAARTWLIYTFPPVLEAVYPQIMEAARNEFQLVSRFDGTVAEGAIFVSRFDGPAAGLAAR